MKRVAGVMAILVLASGCERANPRASVTVHLPPPGPASPAPGFSSAVMAPAQAVRG